jgi:hypothetical protein
MRGRYSRSFSRRRPLHRRLAKGGRADCVTAAIARNSIMMRAQLYEAHQASKIRTKWWLYRSAIEAFRDLALNGNLGMSAR